LCYGFPIFQCNHAEDLTAQFLDLAPIPESVVLLRLEPDRVLADTDAPVLLQLGAFSQDFVFEVARECIVCHAHMIRQRVWEGNYFFGAIGMRPIGRFFILGSRFYFGRGRLSVLR
jgi:hypothetical protein